MIDYSLSHGIGKMPKNTIKLKINNEIKRKMNNVYKIKNISPTKTYRRIYIKHSTIQKGLDTGEIIDDTKFISKYTMVNSKSKENNEVNEDSIYCDSIFSDDFKNYILMDDKTLNYNKEIGNFSNSSSDNNVKHFFKNQKIRDVIERSNEK